MGLIDRSDPRTLQIGMGVPRGVAPPGEAMMSTPMGDRPSSYVTLTLNFEDVSRCHHADQHLQRRRLEVRSQLMRKALTFVEGCCNHPAPDLREAEFNSAALDPPQL